MYWPAAGTGHVPFRKKETSCSVKEVHIYLDDLIKDQSLRKVLDYLQEVHKVLLLRND